MVLLLLVGLFLALAAVLGVLTAIIIRSKAMALLPPAQASQQVLPSSFRTMAQIFVPNAALNACTVANIPNLNTELVASLNMQQFGNAPDPNLSPACGQCLLVQGPNGSVQVKVVDKCMGCGVGGINLSQAAIQAVGGSKAVNDGRVQITWQPCPH